MRRTFADLSRLFDRNPTRFREEVERLRVEDPDRLERFVEWLRRDASKESRPMTGAETDALVETLAVTLGWPKQRVLAEALLRLHASLAEDGPFRPFTAEPGPRRRQSIEALVMPKRRA